MADALTATRVILSAYLVWLGFGGGVNALSSAILILLAAWLTDVLDGILARRSQTTELSWIGKHEDVADMTMSLGVIGYLVFSGFLASTVGTVLAFVILALWLYSYPLAWPIYAIPYVILFLVALRFAPLYAWLLAAYLLIALALRGPRLLREYLPLLIHSLRHPRRRDD
jgi:MFS family permease